jgi:hypothetical protein
LSSRRIIDYSKSLQFAKSRFFILVETVSYPKLFQKINETDALLAQFEAEVIDRVEGAVNQSFRSLEQELRRKWGEGEGKDLAGRDRAILLLSELSDYLSLLPGGTPQIQDIYKELISNAATAGTNFGSAAINSIAPGLAIKTVRPNLKAVAYQAQDAAKRLYRHDTDFQLRASQVIEQGLVQGSGVGRVALALRRELGTTLAKAETIARTETIAAMDSAARDTYRRNGIKFVQRIGTQDRLICAFCAARVGNVYELDQAPVALHPRDRCYNAPWSKQWVELGLVDEPWLRRHKTEIASRLAAQDQQPNYGLAPFERLSGRLAPPEVVWRIGGQGSDRASNRVSSSSGGSAGGEASNPNYTNEFIERGKKATVSLEQQARAANEEIQLAEARLKRASDALDLKFDELDDMGAAFKSAEGIEYVEANKNLTDLKTERTERLMAAMAGLRESLIAGTPPLSSKLKVSKAATAEMSSAKLKSSVGEFSQLTGGKGVGTLKKITLVEDRAWADSRSGELNIGRNGEEAQVKRVLFHELGHFVESENPQLAKAAQDWVLSRSTGALARLNEIDSAYEDDEVYYPDKFVDPYVGRVYADGATEVISMGIENFIGPAEMAEFYNRDAEHFNFILGILTND